MTRRLAVQALLAYLVLRAVSAVLIVLASRDQVPVPGWTDGDVGYLDMTSVWDGDWYRTIAEQGYPQGLPRGADGQVAQNGWAFYPLFPFVSRMVMGATGLSFPVVGSTIALLCGAAAAVLMAGLLSRRVGDRTALLAVAVWAAFPAAPALQLAYTEGPAMLGLTAFLWQLDRRRWGWAGVVAVFIGLTRPIAAPLAVVFAVALLIRWLGRRTEPIPWGEYVEGAVASIVTALSALIWPLVVWRSTGVTDGYTQTMASWRAGHVVEPFTPWPGMARYVAVTVFDASPSRAETWGPVLLAVLATLLVVAVCGPWMRALGWQLRAWCLAYPAYLVAVLDPFTSIFRYLIPLFPLAVLGVGGGWVRRGHEATAPLRTVRTVVLVVVGIALQWVWVSELLVFVPPSDYPP